MTQTISESLEQLKNYQIAVMQLKASIRVQESVIKSTDNINVIRECYAELLSKCDELDKFTKKP